MSARGRCYSAMGAAVFCWSMAACEDLHELPRRLSSFEVTLLTAAGTPQRRCLLPGTPTTGIDLTGCPVYERDAQGNTVARVEFAARAIDNMGDLYEDYNALATVRVVPGQVEAAFTQVRFTNGIAGGANGETPLVSFYASFGDTFLWVVDSNPPRRDSNLPGLGQPCGFDSNEDTCGQFSLSCVNSKPEVGFDPQGLAYCTEGCAADDDCQDGYFCGTDFVTYERDASSDTSDGACLRTQPTYAAGAAGPIHLVLPNLADINRADGLINTPFEEEFVEVRRGKMVVTAIRIDGFYVTDTCPLIGQNMQTDPACTPEELLTRPEFNHLFVFSFSRPEDVLAQDQLLSLSGPMSEFNGFTELNFPLFEVDLVNSPQPLPAAIRLDDRIIDHFPWLVVPGGICFDPNRESDLLLLLDCNLALERLEAGRVTIHVNLVPAIQTGSREDMNLERFGQWPLQLTNGRGEVLTYLAITRENIPFFDPRQLGGDFIDQDISGNLRQVAFDDRTDPLWIIEPKDQSDCVWCVND